MSPEAIVIAILALFPHMSGNNRRCIETQQDRIVQQLREVSQPYEPGAPVPPTELTAAVAFVDVAPIDAQHRHTAGTHMNAVRALSRGYQRCGDWDGAIMRFRTGLCNPRRSPSERVRQQGAHYLRVIHRIVERVRRHAEEVHGE